MTFPPYTAAEAQSRETFLALMWALSYPGRVHQLPVGANAFALIAETLLDLETSYFSPDESLQSILASTGAHARPPAEAAYHFYEQISDVSLSDIRQASVGTMLYPDTAATLIIASTLNSGREFDLSGPGVNGQQAIQVGGLPDALWQLRDTACKYPLGWDVFLVDGHQVLGLPRSTRLEQI
ncbi:MAG: phosphonate C-P lyase system protein PhnH [Anaerolineaceae bacterium]|nr:phosphonate C-P lyase system protein PhnH [Anaerolineaceae bacterium]